MENGIRDFPSRVGEQTSKRLGTFSYLPPLDAAEVERQTEYLVRRGLTAMIEHVEPERATARYWYMWKLPLFGETDPGAIRAEVDACIRANPGHHVRLIGFEPKRQTQLVAFVVERGGATS
jgi:ribulose-bisphosphate carboxylase small chain